MIGQIQPAAERPVVYSRVAIADVGDGSLKDAGCTTCIVFYNGPYDQMAVAFSPKEWADFRDRVREHKGAK